MGPILLLAVVFLAAGVIAVPIASRLGLGSVLGYLIAGIAIQPVLGRLHVDVVSIQHFAEFGVVMMLFLVGLELEPKLLWRMRNRLLGLGGLQVVLTTALVTATAVFFGQPWSMALAIGLVLALSSTAIVLQTLNEKGLTKSEGGQASFSVLLFQDLAVIPMLALLPLLAVPELQQAAHGGGAGEGSHGEGLGLLTQLTGWQHVLVTVAAVAAVVVGGSFLTRPLFRFIALARLRELFTALALLIVVGIALLMTAVGLSPALGTFLGGVVLANSEYRHELESSVEPFKGLLLGLFFITVGAAIDFDLLLAELGPIVGFALALMVLKFVVLFFLGVGFRIQGPHRWLFALSLAQAGEFGFVLLSLTESHGVLPPALSDRLLLVVTMTMLLTPLLFVLFDRLIASRLISAQVREPDRIEADGPIIIAGVGRFGGVVNRVLLAAGHKTVVLDHHSEHLERLRAFGIRVFFGDASRPDLLHAAGIEEARMLVIALDDRRLINAMVRHVTEAYPHVHIVARAVDRHHVYELWAEGCRDIIRETFDSAVRAARSALEALGAHPYDAELQVRGYVENDKQMLRRMADVYDPNVPAHENPAYVARVKEANHTYEEAMRGNSAIFGGRNERGWRRPVGECETDTDRREEAETDARG